MADVVCVVEVADEAALRAVLTALRALAPRNLEVLSPWRLSSALDLPHEERRVRVISGAGLVTGLVGGAAAYLLQWWINVVEAPLDIGGRPHDAAPAFIPLTFETAVLCAGVAIFVAFFATAQLPWLTHGAFAIDGIERTTADRILVTAIVDGAAFGATRADLLAAGAVRADAARAIDTRHEGGSA